MNSDDLRTRCREVLAQLEGEIRVAGLQSPVEVIRDRWGVPHIYAENQDDLFFAQGFVAAQDRLFQMDWWRRVARGGTAEVLGTAGVAGDRFARLIKYRGDRDAEWNSYGCDLRRIAISFTSGINAYIDHIGPRLPIEFQLRGYRPGKWQAEDVLGRMSGIIMTRNFRYELPRAKLVADVGVEKARMLAPTDPPINFAPAEGAEFAGIDPEAVLAGYNAATGPAHFTADDGSNNWVVDGTRSASGKPLLASDPHRPILLPALRYLVHLNAPGWNVIGAGEPAVPGVTIGHNARIAWGFTIICTDQSDFFIEETHPDDATKYRVGDDWESMTIVREQLAVRGESEPIEVELRFTRHGPVIHQDESRRRALALKWVGSEPGGAAYLASLAIDRATNWQEFQQALEHWKMPSENVIYADVDGNIGWVAAAATPVRNNWEGLLPVSGVNGNHQWLRFLNVHELPQQFNPPQHIATANHNILPPGYAHTIAHEWAPRFRYERICRRLAEKPVFTLDDFEQMQHDNTTLAGCSLARLAASFRCDDPDLDALRERLARWDGNLSRDSRMGPLYAFWLQQLLSGMFSPHVTDDLMSFVAAQHGVPVILAALESADARWFGPNANEERGELLKRTFVAAVRDARAALGESASQWRWDRLHTISFRHPMSLLSPACADVFDRGPLGQAGDGLCPNATRYEAPPFEQVSGASYRQLFDLADWDRGRVTSAPGQSGQPESPHYDDLLELWATDRYFPLVFSRAAVEENARWRLWLRPA